MILEDEECMNQIAEILTIYQDENSIQEALRSIPYEIVDEDIQNISKLTQYSGTHRLSLKCINLLLEDLWYSSKNQMELFNHLNIKPQKYDLQQKSKIPTDIVDEFILSPVVKRAFKQSIEVINAIIKKYGLPEDIVIELAREKNSKEKQRYIKDIQKKNEKTRKKVESLIAEYGNKNAKHLIEKIRLHDAQEGKCLYSLQDIPLNDLIYNPLNYEVDHIIPRSVSFDNSFHNKVLVKQTENSKKGNRTPYQYMTSGESLIDYAMFKKHILNLSKSKERLSKKKKEYLLEERDINRYEVQKEFINRNIVDTRYATRELANLLKNYFSINNHDVKIKTLNGGFTDYLRKKWDFKKFRNNGHKHHAEDALIIANADCLFKNDLSLDKSLDITVADQGVSQSNRKVISNGQHEAFFQKIKK